MGQRIYKTADGRYVPHGHPDAVALAYSQFDEPPADVLAKMKPKGEDKQRKQRARNKAKAKPEPASAETPADEGTDPPATAEPKAEQE